MVQKNQRIKEKDTYKKEGDKKVSIKKHSTPHLRLGGLRHKKGRTTERANNVKKYRKRKYME
jgi:hypothetical protein